MIQKKCNLCGRPETQVRMLITGVNGNICDDCTQQAFEILRQSGLVDDDLFSTPLAQSRKKTAKGSMKQGPKPTEIKQRLDEYIIGQDDAKRFLSVAVYNHYKRL